MTDIDIPIDPRDLARIKELLSKEGKVVGLGDYDTRGGNWFIIRYKVTPKNPQQASVVQKYLDSLGKKMEKLSSVSKVRSERLDRNPPYKNWNIVVYAKKTASEMIEAVADGVSPSEVLDSLEESSVDYSTFAKIVANQLEDIELFGPIKRAAKSLNIEMDTGEALGLAGKISGEIHYIKPRVVKVIEDYMMKLEKKRGK